LETDSTTISLRDDLKDQGALRSVVLSPTTNLQGASYGQEGFLVLVTETHEVRVVDTAWNGEYHSAKQLEEGALSFTEVELGQDLV
jgi:DUF971 family protein